MVIRPKKKINKKTLLDREWHFWIVFLLGHDLGRILGPNLTWLDGARGARQGRSRPWEKNQFNKRARSGPQI